MFWEVIDINSVLLIILLVPKTRLIETRIVDYYGCNLIVVALSCNIGLKIFAVYYLLKPGQILPLFDKLLYL